MNPLDAAWKEFITTGRITDYLEYKDKQTALTGEKLPARSGEFHEAEDGCHRPAGLQNRG